MFTKAELKKILGNNANTANSELAKYKSTERERLRAKAAKDIENISDNDIDKDSKIAMIEQESKKAITRVGNIKKVNPLYEFDKSEPEYLETKSKTKCSHREEYFCKVVHRKKKNGEYDKHHINSCGSYIPIVFDRVVLFLNNDLYDFLYGGNNRDHLISMFGTEEVSEILKEKVNISNIKGKWIVDLEATRNEFKHCVLDEAWNIVYGMKQMEKCENKNSYIPIDDEPIVNSCDGNPEQWDYDSIKCKQI